METFSALLALFEGIPPVTGACHVLETCEKVQAIIWNENE